MNESLSLHDQESEGLGEMSVRDLIAELKTLQDRQNHEGAVSGYRSLPGQMQRRAVLERRERRIVTELERRHTDGRALQTV